MKVLRNEKMDASCKTLILIDDNSNSFFPDKVGETCICELYNSKTYLARVARKIAFKISPLFGSLFLGSWDKLAKEVNLIVLFETGNAKYILPYLKKRYPQAKTILWFWNTISKTIDPSSINRDEIELWSFDPDDCKQYNMQYNTQFFIKENLNSIDLTKEIKQDAFFIGTDKGRIDALSELKSTFDRENISYFFHVVGHPGERIERLNQNYLPPIKYEEILRLDSQSKAILDVVSSGQHGLTLRPLEALFLKKKLITNFTRIKEYDFYNPNNIFIMGEDDNTKIKAFLESKFEEDVNGSLCNKYDIEKWIDRFIEGGS